MGNIRRRSTDNKLLYVFQILMLLAASQTQQGLSNQYKVGDLDAWGIPTSANPHVYTTWPRKHSFKIGDSLLFLYPPSQGSVIQVTEQSYKTCNLGDPILSMNDGNSLFNITSNGTFYFTSGESGNCEKHQKLRVATGDSAASDDSETDDSTSANASSPSYQPAFGTIPSPASDASSLMSSVFVTAAIAGISAFVSVSSCGI